MDTDGPLGGRRLLWCTQRRRKLMACSIALSIVIVTVSIVLIVGILTEHYHQPGGQSKPDARREQGGQLVPHTTEIQETINGVIPTTPDTSTTDSLQALAMINYENSMEDVLHDLEARMKHLEEQYRDRQEDIQHMQESINRLPVYLGGRSFTSLKLPIQRPSNERERNLAIKYDKARESTNNFYIPDEPPKELTPKIQTLLRNITVIRVPNAPKGREMKLLTEDTIVKKEAVNVANKTAFVTSIFIIATIIFVYYMFTMYLHW